jgi:hypothetical protein
MASIALQDPLFRIEDMILLLTPVSTDGTRCLIGNAEFCVRRGARVSWLFEGNTYFSVRELALAIKNALFL